MLLRICILNLLLLTGFYSFAQNETKPAIKSSASGNVIIIDTAFGIPQLQRSRKKYGFICPQVIPPLRKNILYCTCMMARMFLTALPLMQENGE